METKSKIPNAVPKVGDAAEPSPLSDGSVCLRGVTVSLASDVGEAFIADCARNVEGLLCDVEIKTKYELSDEDWERLASNAPLLRAVRAHREHRIFNGEAPREAAQRHFTKAPAILNDILTDEQVSPRHRIEAARELRQVAGSGPERAPTPGEKFTIVIDLGGDDKIIKEFTPRGPSLSDDGEPL
jgi:hypothetical protein